MLKYILTYLLIGLTGVVFAQKKSTINLVKSTTGVVVKINGQDVWKVYNATFQQKYSTLSSDSAYVYLKDNVFDAFGHVVITQGDTLHVYSDKLNYNDNTKIAILTDNVKMVDKDAVLTTNHLTYNTATRIGTYVEGGKLVNKGNTLVSRNGYYFALSRDSYFRYDVKLTTTDANIVTDTLRYNSGDRIAYFLGPTNIYGKKDKDTLYTENGTYNTITEQAAFGKNNLYKSGTRSLKGDSLFYDRLKGYGRAVKRITFEDKEQKIIIKGNLGEHYKADGRVVVTQNAYAILITESRDTTNADSATRVDSIKLDSTRKVPTVVPNNLNKTLKQTPPKNTTPLLDGALANLPARPDTAALRKQLAEVKPDSLKKKLEATETKKTVQQAVKAAPDVLKNLKPNLTTKPNAAAAVKKPLARDTAARIKRDSMYIGADTLETQMMTYKAQKDLQEKIRIANTVDTTRKLRKPFVPYKTLPKYIDLQTPKFIPTVPDYTIYSILPPPPDTTKKKTEVAVKPAASKPAPKKPERVEPAKPKGDDLSLIKDREVNLSDTARVRILSAHHNVRIFRKDFQSRSDSLFYSSSDSVIRSFVKPMVWAEGSQLSGDTIYLQMKNKKLDNMDVWMNSFAANVEKGDSTHFNQLGGKRMKAFFKNNKLDKLYVTGNAENVYFMREKGKITQMHRSLSSAIWVYMKKGEMSRVAFLTKPENRDFPIAKAKEEDMILKNFIWKPKERPRSKEDVINPPKPEPVKPKVNDKKSPTKTTPAKPTVTDSGKPAMMKDSSAVKRADLRPVPAVKKDSVAKVDSVNKAPAAKALKDTLKMP